MATRDDWLKKRVKASGSSGAARGTHRSGALPSIASVAKIMMRPSAEKYPRGRSAKKCRACCQGAPIRRVCKKAQRTAGYGRGGLLQVIESAQTAADVTGRAVHRAGYTTRDRFAYRSWACAGDQRQRDCSRSQPWARRARIHENRVQPEAVVRSQVERGAPWATKKAAANIKRASQTAALMTMRRRDCLVACAAARRSALRRFCRLAIATRIGGKFLFWQMKVVAFVTRGPREIKSKRLFHFK
jgi:hypothetical protein